MAKRGRSKFLSSGVKLKVCPNGLNSTRFWLLFVLRIRERKVERRVNQEYTVSMRYDDDVRVDSFPARNGDAIYKHSIEAPGFELIVHVKDIMTC